MDAISLDDWELLPDHKSFFFLEEDCSSGRHGAVDSKDQLLLGAELVVIDMDHFAAASHPPPYDCIPDEEEDKEPVLLLPSQDACVHDPATEFKDIVVVPAEPRQEELVSKVTEILIYGEEDHDEMVRSPAGVKEADQEEVLVEAAAPDADDQCAREEEGVNKTGLSVGNLRVNGVGALCSFGVAAATFFIFLLGGKQQQKRQDHKIHRQMYAGDERIQQVVQQASRLNQTMSSVMGGASSARASISFGGYYQGF
ncbi:uncharacterized protein C2845_PM01G22890 [Panicum miliaceum]|uniref:DUF6821 domain-containing protein n=1 Tax=Panicum miliaceum TaxID=4540 RepID=A0A3L6TP38_PANMI|nr:uncharacterized protein C2845_PM01G22890 [Panicum miliaceum]